MLTMAVPYELTGRTRQKARTRDALIRATRTLLAAGVTPTVEQAADAAEVSRTTAYRYFPNQRALLVATFPEIAATSLLPDPPPQDPMARVEAVAEALARQVVEHEPELRAQLRLSLEPEDGDRPGLPYRTGRAIAWIEEALAPLRGRMPEPELRRLTLAIRSAVGIEALVWLTDVARLSREEAADVMLWSAHALVQSALAQQDSPHNPAA
jgi:AcrR family transcriptional regulator